ncbi:MAG: sigma-70 family RNA polymerase sigma factor [Sphingobacteriales bacterium]|jgi:RNA polymerase sigma factor (sigma-70 family)|nr:MAG: sigma-70 family RNA polymerase sigma factor [Sphingobacteriales bacterium]
MKLSNTHTLTQLLEGCKANNRLMQEMLYQQYATKMMAICMRYAKDKMEAEDVLQIGFIKIFKEIASYRGEGNFEGWMRKIMVNTAIESYRKNLRFLNVVSLDDAFEHATTGFDCSNLAMQDLLKLIQKLADGYRLVFNMYVIEGYSHKEIAATLGISESTSKSQLSRARAILQQEIIKMEGFGYATQTR